MKRKIKLKIKWGRWKILFLAILIISALSTASFAQSAVDPSEIGTGARYLGMGRAFVGMSDDASGLFINPAGVAKSNSWQANSMYSYYLDSVTDILLSGVLPTDYGNIGIGFIGVSVGDSAMTARSTTTSRIISTGQTISYSSNMAMLSYSTPASRFTDMEFLKDVYIGSNLKFFSQGFSGGANASAFGYDMDFGAIYQPFPWARIGVSQLNTLPAWLGATLTWTTGQKESLPMVTKIGSSLKILGKNSPYEIAKNELYLNTDVDLFITGRRPTLLHTGLEWWPVDYVALRLGLDQDAVATGGGGTGISQNLTAGIGFRYEGIEFDYAFHQYDGLAANNTNYFSLSYVGKEIRKIDNYIIVYTPDDYIMTHFKDIKVTGLVLEPEFVKYVKIDGQTVAIKDDKTFELVVEVKALGKKAIPIVAYGNDDKELETFQRRLILLPTFPDVPKGYWVKFKVEILATLGIIKGFPDGEFKPENNLTRAELTTLMVRAKEVEDKAGETITFTDVSEKHWAAKFIIDATKAAYVEGYPDGSFRPPRHISRAEAVTIVSRFAKLAKVIAENNFPDMSERHWAYDVVVAAQVKGILDYLKGKNFEPNRKINRAETVEILSKTDYMTKLIDDYIKGYKLIDE